MSPAFVPPSAFRGETLAFFWRLRDIELDGWDGLVSLYRPLWDAAGQLDADHHQGWMRDLRC
jgi:hypothetical protein